MKLNKETEEEENMIDAVFILPSEDFHRFDWLSWPGNWDCSLLLDLNAVLKEE